MKILTVANLFLLTGSACMAVGLLGNQLGLPSPWNGIPIMIAAVLNLRAFRLIKQAKQAGQIPPFPTLTAGSGLASSS
jgi:uncharacterized membrane protein AbrB (regulator of aidB expression)